MSGELVQSVKCLPGKRGPEFIPQTPRKKPGIDCGLRVGEVEKNSLGSLTSLAKLIAEPGLLVKDPVPRDKVAGF